MAKAQQLTITLDDETAEAVKSKVACGEYASESDVLKAGFLHLVEEHDETFGMGEEAFDSWLRTEVVPVLEELDADPSRILSGEQLRANLAKTFENFKKAG